METSNLAGFAEIEHTADLAIKVWAPDLSELFRQAAVGMFTLMGVRFGVSVPTRRDIDCMADDTESLLVTFLSELLYWIETDRFAGDQFSILIEVNHLNGFIEGNAVLDITKEIKAVTYHNLQIHRVNNRFETTIVFDV